MAARGTCATNGNTSHWISHYYGLVNPASPLAQPMIKALDVGAATLGIQLEILRASSDPEIDAVMGRLQSPANVMVSGTDAFFFVRRSRIAALAMRQSLPTIFDDREYATAGALATYGADFLNVSASSVGGMRMPSVIAVLRLISRPLRSRFEGWPNCEGLE